MGRGAATKGEGESPAESISWRRWGVVMDSEEEEGREGRAVKASAVRREMSGGKRRERKERSTREYHSTPDSTTTSWKTLRMMACPDSCRKVLDLILWNESWTQNQLSLQVPRFDEMQPGKKEEDRAAKDPLIPPLPLIPLHPLHDPPLHLETLITLFQLLDHLRVAPVQSEELPSPARSGSEGRARFPLQGEKGEGELITLVQEWGEGPV